MNRRETVESTSTPAAALLRVLGGFRRACNVERRGRKINSRSYHLPKRRRTYCYITFATATSHLCVHTVRSIQFLLGMEPRLEPSNQAGAQALRQSPDLRNQNTRNDHEFPIIMVLVTSKSARRSLLLLPESSGSCHQRENVTLSILTIAPTAGTPLLPPRLPSGPNSSARAPTRMREQCGERFPHHLLRADPRILLDRASDVRLGAKGAGDHT